MKIIFLGGQTAGLIGLLTLLARGYWPDVVSYSECIYIVGANSGLNLLQFIDLSREKMNYDLLVSVHCRNIIPKAMLDSLPLGGINVHPMLSLYKGKDPIGRALADNVTDFSVGVHKMTARVDEGPVLVERHIKVEGAKTPAEVYAKLMPLYSIVLSEAMEMIIDGKFLDQSKKDR